MKKNLFTIFIWAHNKPGVFFRILWLFRKKQFNVESATVGHSEKPGITRFTLTISGAELSQLENMRKQVFKLIDVTSVELVFENDLIARELALVTLEGPVKKIAKLLQIYHAEVIFEGKNSLTIEATGTETDINNLYQELRKNATIHAFVRTGRTAVYKHFKKGEL